MMREDIIAERCDVPPPVVSTDTAHVCIFRSKRTDCIEVGNEAGCYAAVPRRESVRIAAREVPYKMQAQAEFDTYFVKCGTQSDTRAL